MERARRSRIVSYRVGRLKGREDASPLTRCRRRTIRQMARLLLVSACQGGLPKRAGRWFGPYRRRTRLRGTALGGALTVRNSRPSPDRLSGPLTIPESAYGGEHGGVEDPAVIVEPDDVEVDDPGGLAWFDHELGKREDVGAVFGCAGQDQLPDKGEPKEGAYTDARRMLRSREERTCASSGGGPGRNKGEHSALRSMLGTVMSALRGVRCVCSGKGDADAGLVRTDEAFVWPCEVGRSDFERDSADD